MQVNNDFYPVESEYLDAKFNISKSLTPNNYNINSPLDKSITFCSSVENNPLLKRENSIVVLEGYEDNATSFHGKPIFKQKYTQHRTVVDKEVVNLALTFTYLNDNSVTLSKNYSYEIYKQRWQSDFETSYQVATNPIISYAWDSGALNPNIYVAEYYIDTTDVSGGTWVYSERRIFTIDNFLTYASNIHANDVASHTVLCAFVTQIRFEYIKSNSEGGNYGGLISFFDMDIQTFAFYNAHTENGETVIDDIVTRNAYYYGDLLYGRFGGANGFRVYDGDATIPISHLNFASIDYLRGAIYRSYFDDETLIPIISDRTQIAGAYVTRCGDYSYGVPVENFTLERLAKMTATYGLPFFTDYSSWYGYSEAYFKQYGYLPIIENGYYNGKYIKYSDIANTPDNLLNPQQKNAKTNYFSKDGNYPYIHGNPNPSSESTIDKNPKTKEIDLEPPKLTTTSIFNSTYAMTATGIDDLSHYLWNSDNNIFDRIVENAKLYNKPMDALVNIMLFPFDVRAKSGATTAQNIKFGRTELENVQGVKLPRNANAIFDLGSCTLYPKFKDFRDYEPYTTATLYIPYCAPVKISPSMFSNKTIRVKLVVDFLTGECVGVVFCENVAVEYSNGKCGINIPVSAGDNSRNDMKVVNDIYSVGKSIASGKVDTNAVFDAFDALQSFGDIDILQKGCASSSVSTRLPQKCYLEVSRVKTSAFENYGNTRGFACNIYTQVGNNSGLVVVENPKIDVSCLDVEKQEIATLLQNGIFV